MKNSSKEVQRVCSGTLDQFVLEPTQKYAQSYLLIAIRRIKNVVRWKEFLQDPKKQPTMSILNKMKLDLSLIV